MYCGILVVFPVLILPVLIFSLRRGDARFHAGFCLQLARRRRRILELLLKDGWREELAVAPLTLRQFQFELLVQVYFLRLAMTGGGVKGALCRARHHRTHYFVF